MAIKAIKVISDPDKFKLLADGTRRKIVFLLRATDMTVTQISSNLNISRQTIYHHIQKLLDADLVQVSRKEQVGHLTESYYRATAEAFYCSVGSTSDGREFFKKNLKTVLNSLKEVGFNLQYDDNDVQKLIAMQKEQDDCCDMNEKWNRISHLQDVDDKSKHLISDYAKQLVMTDEEFEYDLKKKKEFRVKLKTLLKEKSEKTDSEQLFK